MFKNTTKQKLVQMSEEVLPPIHVPIVVGNDCFIVTQQDVRKIEDMRLFTYNMLTSSGELVPIGELHHDENLRNAIMNACTYRKQIEQNSTQPSTTSGILAELAEYLINLCQKSNNHEVGMQQVPMAASLQQQLQWEKCTNNPSTSHPTYTTGDLMTNTIHCPKKPCFCCNKKSTCTRGSNTMDFEESTQNNSHLSAREQLKQKKITQECMNVM